MGPGVSLKLFPFIILDVSVHYGLVSGSYLVRLFKEYFHILHKCWY